MTEVQRVVHLTGLAPQVDESLITAFLLPFGVISSVKIPPPDASSALFRAPERRTFRENVYAVSGSQEYDGPPMNRGFAFVAFEDPADAALAASNRDGAELCGRPVTASLTTTAAMLSRK